MDGVGCGCVVGPDRDDSVGMIGLEVAEVLLCMARFRERKSILRYKY